MPSCVAFGCHNRSTAYSKGVTFHKFPKNEERRKTWMAAVRRLDWQPISSSVLCSEHFCTEDLDRTSLSCVRVRENAVPSIFAAFPSYMQKEAIVICLDIGSTMSNQSEDSETDLQKSLNCITMILQRKMFAELKDEVALVLFGSPNTVNDLAEGSQYQNITVARSLALPDWDLLEYIETKIECSENITADFIDAMVVCVDLLIKTQTKKFGDKRLILFSNFGAEFGDDQFKNIVGGMKIQNILLNVIGPDLNDEENLKKSTQQKKGETLVKSILEELDGECYSFNQALPALSFFQIRSVKPWPWKCQLQLSQNFSISVTTFLKVKDCKPKQNWKTAYAKEETAGLVKETTYHLNNEEQTEIERENMIEAYRYGTTLVPFSEEDKSNMAFQPPGKHLKVLGYTKKENIKHHHYMGDCVYTVVAESGDESAAIALSALIHALFETNTAIVARYCYGGRSMPKLCALFPHIKTNYQCLFMVFLPFMEDLRQYTFSSLTSSKKYIPTAEQLSAVDDLITQMDLTKNGDDEGCEEALKPKLTFNPYIQRLYQCMYHRILNPDEPLPELSPLVANYLKQDLELLDRCKPVVQKLKKFFPLKEIKKKPEEQTGASIFQQSDKDDPAAKRLRPSDNLEGGLAGLIGGIITEVGTVNPVSDFQSMISRKDEDLFDDACRQMEKRILQLITDSFGSQFYEKALNCLKCLRQISIKNTEAVSFNKFLQELRELLHQRSRIDFWEILVKDKLSLIHSGESGESNVSPAEAGKFLEESVIKPVEKEPEDIDEDAEDLLAMM